MPKTCIPNLPVYYSDKKTFGGCFFLFITSEVTEEKPFTL